MSELPIQDQIKAHRLYTDGKLFSIQDAYQALQTMYQNRCADESITTNRVAQVLGEMSRDGHLLRVGGGQKMLYSSPDHARSLISHAWVPDCFIGDWINIGSNRAAM